MKYVLTLTQIFIAALHSSLITSVCGFIGSLSVLRRGRTGLHNGSKPLKYLFTDSWKWIPSESTTSRWMGTNGNMDDSVDEERFLANILQQYNLADRLVTIQQEDLPIVAEIFAEKSWQLCIIKKFKAPASVSSAKAMTEDKKIISPLVEVLMIDRDGGYDDGIRLEEKTKVVDIGQITTVFKFPVNSGLDEYANFLSRQLCEAERSLEQDFPVNHNEKIMQGLYEERNSSRIGITKRGKGKVLTKKNIGRISSNASDVPQIQMHLQQILRKAVKAGMQNGEKSSRLVDSLTCASALVKNYGSGKLNKTQILLAGAVLLAMDADLGGRFKRTPCIFVSAAYGTKGDLSYVRGVSLLNGGWMAVDESERAGAEARKFVERNKNPSLNSNAHKEKSQNVLTAADERIIYRLECLAMGEELSGDGSQLEVDVREALAAFSLDKSQEGARQALIKIGRWSQADLMTSNKPFEPWSVEILECSRKLREVEAERRYQLYEKCAKLKTAERKQMIDERTDLTVLPAICIDAKRASFRDDAIGIRRRASTGRKLRKGSKWEVLVHIADVSDIYSPEIVVPKEFSLDLVPLRKAAESRGSSRYDLPNGPLHLMPPVALESLSLDTKRGPQSQQSKKSVNCCVTLWAYIDETSGKIIDAGLERTIIQMPLAMTFEEATKLLESKEDALPKGARQTKQMLTIIDKILTKWKENQLQHNEAAQKRENRMKVKELVAKETLGSKAMRDDGAKGSFQRSRGHMVVDRALDIYGNALSVLLSRAKAPIPRASGSGRDRGGRLGTAPLRRYIDGVAQRQALSVLCNYGGPPMTRKECSEANKIATNAINKINNLRSSKKASEDFSSRGSNDLFNRKRALRSLESHFATFDSSKKRIVPAMSTGVKNQVVISGLGVLAKCNGVKGTLKSGERIPVMVTKLNADEGLIEVKLVRR